MSYAALFAANSPQTQSIGKPALSNSTSSSSMGGFSAGASIATAAASIYGSIVSGQIAKIQFDMKKQASEFNARLAKTQAAMANAELITRYNDSMANTVTIMSAQGVDMSSGSKANILRSQQQKLNFDLEYNRLSSDITQSQYRNEAGQFGMAGQSAKRAGVTQGLLQGLQTVQDFSKVK
jgi:hypothetical protein